MKKKIYISQQEMQEMENKQQAHQTLELKKIIHIIGILLKD